MKRVLRSMLFRSIVPIRSHKFSILDFCRIKPKLQASISIMRTQKIWQAIALLSLLGIVILMEVNKAGMEKGFGIYFLDLIYYNRLYKLVSFLMCGIIQYSLIMYLLRVDKILSGKEWASTIERWLAFPAFILIQGVNAFLLFFSCVYLIVFLVLPFGFRHCDTIQSGQKVYHLDLFKGFDRNYRLIQCNSWGFCKILHRSRDEDSRQNEKLTIDSQGFIIATSSNSSKPIIWYQYTDNGRSIDVIDRISIK
jgi:hypothetical protein